MRSQSKLYGPFLIHPASRTVTLGARCATRPRSDVSQSFFEHASFRPLLIMILIFSGKVAFLVDKVLRNDVYKMNGRFDGKMVPTSIRNSIPSTLHYVTYKPVFSNLFLNPASPRCLKNFDSLFNVTIHRVLREYGISRYLK